MWSRRKTTLSIFLVLLVASVLFGCRAFEPEVVIVNRPPDTFIMGAPAETSGGYFHFHVFWYGTDSDGIVERFVWALSDTSIQDLETDDDEEDQRFNPALNISTLEIGNWTTKKDTVFNFSLNQGSVLAYDLTLHMVAVDDRGDFDRTPARLHFISNALGNPSVTFYKHVGNDSIVFSMEDTIAYGEPFTISWAGSTQNIRSFTQEQLQAADTVPYGLPPDVPRDGLLGFKYRLPEVDCDDSREDCWNPRYYDDAAGDSVSFFGSVQKLVFTNDNSGSDIFYKRLVSGLHRLLVNSTDVAGVEIPLAEQEMRIVVNYDPETRLLRNERDPLPVEFPEYYSYEDTNTYPYYRVFMPDGSIVQETFVDSARIPDRSYVVFKALGKDDERDLKLFPDSSVTFQGLFHATGLYNLIAPYNFTAEYGPTNRTTAWEPDYSVCPDCWSADTLGFLVGPFKYDFQMRCVDEHEARDGTHEEFTFYGNFPPCVQCVELLNLAETSSYPVDSPCDDPVCASSVDSIFASLAPVPELHMATEWRTAPIYFNVSNGVIWTERPVQLAGVDSIDGTYYAYRLLLHGMDHELEPALLPEDRILSWRYELIYENDPDNAVNDGGGSDGLDNVTRRFQTNDSSAEIYIDDAGVWIMRIEYFVPQFLMLTGSEGYLNFLRAWYVDETIAATVFDLTTKQLGDTRIRVKARDASDCDWRSDRSKYHYYTGVRPPQVPNQGEPGNFHTHRDCDASYTNASGFVELDYYSFESAEFTKTYKVKVRIGLPNGDVEIYPVH